MHVSSPSSRALVVSVVSHDHGLMVQELLLTLAEQCATSVARVILTQNLPEERPCPPPQGWPFVLELRCNKRPLGFGENHNRALHGAMEPFVCVLNPDVGIPKGQNPFAGLIETAAAEGVGCAYPVQVSVQGLLQDSEREIPTLPALIRRRLCGLGERRVDWVNAACLVLPSRVWRDLRGFDENYFMYCEDVDLSLRLRLSGFSLRKAPVTVVHTGQRASRQNWRHKGWHIRSLLRLWSSSAFWRGLQLLHSDEMTHGRIGPP